MGGDFGPSVAVPAALSVVARQPCVDLLLVGDERQIKPHLQSAPADQLSRIEILHTPDSLSNLIKPESALRGHRTSSMYLAVDQLRQQQASACVSAGNSGALMLIGRHLLKTVPGILRPALLASIPTSRSNRKSYLLDVGAHVNSSAEELFQFAVMGALLAAADLNCVPRVGLLNIGAEEYKGTEHIRKAARALELHGNSQKNQDRQTGQQNGGRACLHYIGFIEANRIYAGDADVIVCDGFTGNVTIKTSAGVVHLIEEMLQQTVASSRVNRLLGLLARPLLRSLRECIDPSRFNGASILGLQGTVIKSHGNASTRGFAAAILQADREIQAGVSEMIAEQARDLLRDPMGDVVH